MAVNWPQQQLERYAAEATLLTERLQKQSDPHLLDIALNLLRTYCTIPAQDGHVCAADSAITKLACVIYTPIQQRGDWFEILRIWPQLRQLAGRIAERECEVALTVQWAIVLNALGCHFMADELYVALLSSPDFTRLPRGWQAEILHEASVCYLDQGKYHAAQLLLDRGLDITAAFETSADPAPETLHELKQQHVVILWKERTYILNLRGNLALLRGDFHQARACYEDCLAIYSQYDQEDNFSCIAYQSLGRLLLHQRQFEAALPVLEKNRAICVQRGVREGVIDSCIYLAGAQIGLGALDEAEALLGRAYVESKALQRAAGMALCHFYWGKLAQKKGQHRKAIGEWRKTLRILAASQSPQLELPTLVALCHSALVSARLRTLLTVSSRLYTHMTQRRVSIAMGLFLLLTYW